MADAGKREQWTEWLEEFQGESDRACAVLGPAFLDEQLRALLEAFLVNDPGRVPDLFEGAAGPLASFSARIGMSYALGFLAPSEMRDVDLIRKIRNDFAHELHGVSFQSSSVASRCRELTGCNHLVPFTGEMTPRLRFVMTVLFLANWIALRRLGIRDQRRVVHEEVKKGEVKDVK
jgi:DNA-binding MltR family transcriptional regulator